MSQLALSPTNALVRLKDYFQERYLRYPGQYYFVIRGSQLGALLELSPHDVKELDGVSLQLEGNRLIPTRECVLLVRPAPTEQSGFKVYGVLRQANSLEAIIQLGVETIQSQMNAEDIDAPPVEIVFPLVNIRDAWHDDTPTQTTSARGIAKEITARLERGETRIVATWKEEDGIFECRRT